jgi:hypothetical protein
MSQNLGQIVARQLIATKLKLSGWRILERYLKKFCPFLFQFFFMSDVREFCEY